MKELKAYDLSGKYKEFTIFLRENKFTLRDNRIFPEGYGFSCELGRIGYKKFLIVYDPSFSNDGQLPRPKEIRKIDRRFRKEERSKLVEIARKFQTR